MKYITFSFIVLFGYMAGCKITKPASEIRQEVTQPTNPETENTTPTINFSEQSTWILGYFNPVQMTREPYSSWYFKTYDDYKLNTEVINKLQEISKDGLTIKVIMGTWCPDSRREVPRFIRILNIWKFPLSGLHL